MAHTPVDGYKENTASVVWVRGERSATSLVFKDVDLSPGTYPAIIGFPGRPGLPEASIYADGDGDLARFLPECYHLETVADGAHYRYYLEDLNIAHRSGFSRTDELIAVDAAVAVGEAIETWLESHPDAPTVRYDDGFAAGFLEYAHEALAAYADRTGERSVASMIDAWERIAATYLANTPDAADASIHGDFRRGNVFYERRDPTRVKLVDWEFAGVGWLHNDLASILKLSDDETTRLSLERLAVLRPERPLEEHRRLYERCRLERGLLDAALVARQRLAKEETPTISVTHAERVHAAVRALGEGARPGG